MRLTKMCGPVVRVPDAYYGTVDVRTAFLMGKELDSFMLK